MHAMEAAKVNKPLRLRILKSLLFSFELCSTIPYSVAYGCEKLALLFSFELCFPCHMSSRTRWAAPCYFLLNYAFKACCRGCCGLWWRLELAIFFWIMHSQLAYILTSLAHLLLLFSFELCICIQMQTFPGNTMQLAIFFWIMLKIVIDAAIAPVKNYDLLFSFELCGKIIAVPRSDAVVLKVLLFSFELCTSPRDLDLNLSAKCILLFSFELCWKSGFKTLTFLPTS